MTDDSTINSIVHCLQENCHSTPYALQQQLGCKLGGGGSMKRMFASRRSTYEQACNYNARFKQINNSRNECLHGRRRLVVGDSRTRLRASCTNMRSIALLFVMHFIKRCRRAVDGRKALSGQDGIHIKALRGVIDFNDDTYCRH